MASHPIKPIAARQLNGLPVFLSLFGWLFVGTSNQQPAIENGSFEVPRQRDRFLIDRYQKCPHGAIWTFSGHSGIACNGSIFDFDRNGNSQPTPAGTQFAFLECGEDFGGTLEQRVFGWKTNVLYTVCGLSRREGPGNAPGVYTATLMLDGAVLTSVSPAESAWVPFSTKPFAIAEGSHVLTFVMPTADLPSGVFLDDVRIEVDTNFYGTTQSAAIQGTTNSTR
jgi:hypothetical protein